MNRISARERFLVLVMLLLGAGAAVYAWLLVPQAAARARAQAEIERFGAVVQRIDGDGAALLPRAADTRPVPAIVAESARDTAIPIRRLEPEGPRTRLTLDEVGFDLLMVWLADLDTVHTIQVVAIEIERSPEPGIVTARIVLER